MSKEKLKPAKEQGKPAPNQAVPTLPAKPVTPPLLRKIDWLTFGITTLIVFIGYYLTLAPDLTLEDSGELAVGSFYAGVKRADRQFARIFQRQVGRERQVIADEDNQGGDAESQPVDLAQQRRS